jgi:hypothetical protein
MRSRVVGVVLIVAAAVAVLGACNLREGPNSEYGSLEHPNAVEQNSTN